MFRYKDISGWWANPHVERRGGLELAAPTAWVPGMKPVWFTELGCPAVDKGANQPNVFPDPKSAENALPHFSNGRRSASQQRRFIEAHLDHWQAMAASGMVDLERIYLWSFDARPYPAFPDNGDLWSDGANWATGHWLNGRLGAGTLAEVIAAILRDHGFMDFDVSEVSGDLAGYVQGEVTSARALIEPLLQAFRIDAIERDGRIVFRSRDRASLPATAIDVVADIEGEPLWRETRGHESDFADEAVLTFSDMEADYEEASSRSRRLASGESRVLGQDLPAAMDEETALEAVEAMLRDHRIARRQLEFSISPSQLSVEPGDVLALTGGPQGRFLVTRIEEGASRRLFLREMGAAVTGPVVTPSTPRQPENPATAGFAPILHLLDLPCYEPGAAETFTRAATLTRPWRRVALSSSTTGEGYRSRVVLDRPATLGRLAAPLLPGVSGRLDRANAVEAEIFFGGLSSVDRDALFDGANRLAVRTANGGLEVIGFSEAEETAPGRWRLTGLLRGLAGTEDAMASGAETGAELVLLDAAVKPLGLAAEEAGRSYLWLAEQAGGAAAPAGPFSFAGGMRAQTPLSPVHPRARRLPDGNVVFSWTRRGRIDADDWVASDIPLDEPEERYRLEILDGGETVRSVEVSAPSFLYVSEEELADFGAAQAVLAIRLRQLGRKVPLGLPTERVLAL